MIELLEILGKKYSLNIFVIESKRKWNQMNAIKRYLIQIIIPKWLNISILNSNIRIMRIDANLLKTKFKTFNDLMDLPIKVIYYNNICKKDIKGEIKIDNNIKIIENITKYSDLEIKMNLTFRDVLKLFFNMETNLIKDNLKEGLQDYKQYFSSIKNNIKKKHRYKYLEKFIYILNEISMMAKDDSKQFEKITDLIYHDLFD